MGSKEIILHFNRVHFEEIYFKENQGDYYKDPTIKNKFWILVLYTIGFLLTILFFNSYYEKEIYIVFFILLCILVYDYYTRLLVLKKWKNDIREYLNNQEGYTYSKITLTNAYFSLVQDENEVIEKWTNFNALKIEDTHILLISDQENYMFPNKSMSISDYNSFTSFIKEKIRG